MVIVTAQSDGGSGSAVGLLWLLFIVAAFYMFIVRPNRKRMRAMQEAQAALAPGREVITAAGIYGTIRDVDADSFTMETAPGVTMRVARGAVMKLVEPAGGPTADTADTAEAGEV